MALLRPRHRAPGDRPLARDGRVRLAARAERLRQDDGAPPRGRLRPARLGADRRRRQGHHGQAAQQARHGHGLPGLQPVPEHDRRAERRLRAQDPAQGQGRPAEAGRRAARARRARRRGQALPAPALRRHAAARRARPRARDRAERAAPRRAALGARREGARAAARGDPPHPARARDHDDLRHARPGGGALDLRPRRGDVRRQDRAGRVARRRCTAARRRRSSRSSSAR